MQSKLFNDPNLGNSTHSPGAARKLLAEKKYGQAGSRKDNAGQQGE